MAELHEVTVKVISQTGTCSAGHKTGDEFVVGYLTPSGVCSWAFNLIWPFVAALQTGGNFPWDEEGRAVVACPDSANPVVFELRRR